MHSAGAVPERVSRIVLTGFMGAGKSTVGALLAASLGWTFSDVDERIVKEQGASIATLFARHGEPRFRELETTATRSLLSENRIVIALGGGALETPATRDLLLEAAETCTVFLETPLELAIARCGRSSAPARPLLQDPSQLAQRFNRRAEYYRRAHLTLSTVGRSPDELVSLLLASVPPLMPAGR